MASDRQQQNNTVFVYVATFDDSVEVGEVQPAIRNEEIQRCSDLLTKQQRYCVWQLLDFALREQFGKGVSDFEFTVTNGKWYCDGGVYFSLTHSGHVVAVAVNNDDVGVDLEAVSSFAGHANDGKFIARVLTDAEAIEFAKLSPERQIKALAELWTRKESLFKLNGGANFVPKLIDTAVSHSQCHALEIDSTLYSLAVATEMARNVEFKAMEIANLK